MTSFFIKTLNLRRPKQNHYQNQIYRTFVEARVQWVRDRGLDHAVEKEKHLRPMLALKNLIKSEPSKSLPISVASEQKTQLSLPTRTIEFIRDYPSVFQEFIPPGGSPARPHVRLTPEILHLDDEEQLIYSNPTHRNDIADRLLKLLMLTRVNKLPLHVIDRFQWDLGLPHDYVRTLLSDYPDYFQVTSIKSEFSSYNNTSKKPVLASELVCWSDDFAVSVMEKKARAYTKGNPLSFPLQFSRGFELEKKVKKWLDDWQKLPYISPYENAYHLQSKSDQAEKWTVAILHELLNLLISKKTDKENILCLADYLGLRSRFKRALINHPGIFYVSNKIRTHTVVLREAYKRNLLLQKHPLMGMRYQYIHLMNKGKDSVKPIGTSQETSSRKKATSSSAKEGEEEDEDLDEFSGSDAEDASDDESDFEDEDEDEDEDDEEDDDEDDEDMMDNRHNGMVGRGRTGRSSLPRSEMNHQSSRSSVQDSSNRKQPNMVGDRVPTPVREDHRRGRNGNGRSSSRPQVRSRYPRGEGKLLTERKGASG